MVDIKYAMLKQDVEIIESQLGESPFIRVIANTPDYVFGEGEEEQYDEFGQSTSAMGMVYDTNPGLYTMAQTPPQPQVRPQIQPRLPQTRPMAGQYPQTQLRGHQVQDQYFDYDQQLQPGVQAGYQEQGWQQQPQAHVQALPSSGYPRYQQPVQPQQPQYYDEYEDQLPQQVAPLAQDLGAGTRLRPAAHVQGPQSQPQVVNFSKNSPPQYQPQAGRFDQQGRALGLSPHAQVAEVGGQQFGSVQTGKAGGYHQPQSMRPAYDNQTQNPNIRKGIHANQPIDASLIKQGHHNPRYEDPLAYGDQTDAAYQKSSSGARPGAARGGNPQGSYVRPQHGARESEDWRYEEDYYGGQMSGGGQGKGKPSLNNPPNQYYQKPTHDSYGPKGGQTKMGERHQNPRAYQAAQADSYRDQHQAYSLKSYEQMPDKYNQPGYDQGQQKGAPYGHQSVESKRGGKQQPQAGGSKKKPDPKQPPRGSDGSQGSQNQLPVSNQKTQRKPPNVFDDNIMDIPRTLETTKTLTDETPGSGSWINPSALHEKFIDDTVENVNRKPGFNRQKKTHHGRQKKLEEYLRKVEETGEVEEIEGADAELNAEDQSDDNSPNNLYEGAGSSKKMELDFGDSRSSASSQDKNPKSSVLPEVAEGEEEFPDMDSSDRDSQIEEYEGDEEQQQSPSSPSKQESSKNSVSKKSASETKQDIKTDILPETPAE